MKCELLTCCEKSESSGRDLVSSTSQVSNSCEARDERFSGRSINPVPEANAFLGYIMLQHKLYPWIYTFLAEQPQSQTTYFTYHSSRDLVTIHDWRLFGVVLRSPGGFGSSKFFKRPMTPMTNFLPRTLLGRSRTARVGARASRVVRVLRLAGEPGAIPGLWPWLIHWAMRQIQGQTVLGDPSCPAELGATVFGWSKLTQKDTSKVRLGMSRNHHSNLLGVRPCHGYNMLYIYTHLLNGFITC